jgi:peptidyl-prolyl cis-trans isomerase C
VSVTAGELYQRAADAPEPTQRAWAQDPRGVEALLDRLIADRLLVNEARRRGLDRDPAVRAAVERALVARLRATVINPAVGDGSRVTADDIRVFYTSHPTRFHIPERRRAVVIFIANRRDAERVLRLALMRRHNRPRHEFRDLVRENNTDPDLVRTDGELRDVTAVSTEIDPALRDEIFAIRQPGDVSQQLIHAQWHGTRGYFIVRLTGKRAAIDRTLAESSDWIRQRLVLDRRVAAERALVDHLAIEARMTRVPAARVVRVAVEDAGVPQTAPDGG